MLGATQHYWDTQIYSLLLNINRLALTLLVQPYVIFYKRAELKLIGVSWAE